jgi:hypothetical protein
MLSSWPARCSRILILVIVAITGASAQPPHVKVEAADAALAKLGRQLIPLCQTWYPKIARLIYPPGQVPPPPDEILIEFKHFDDPKIGGFTQNAVIQLSAAEALLPQPLPFEAVVIHELTHVVQGVQVGPQWLYEGIADYIAYTHFLNTNQPYLRLDAKGLLYGYDDSKPYLYSLQQKKIPPNGAYAARGIRAGHGYRHGYTVTAAFLYWLEQNKRPAIVLELNTAMKTHQYHPRLWRKLTGASLEALWREFLKASASL